MIRTLNINVNGQGLHDITPEVAVWISEIKRKEGLCTLFIAHTSASLLVQENYDPAAKRDLECWLNRLVPEGDALYTHTLEGADDMPAHIKSALTASSLSIPVLDGALALGTWQGIFLWEHRRTVASRRVILHFA